MFVNRAIQSNFWSTHPNARTSFFDNFLLTDTYSVLSSLPKSRGAGAFYCLFGFADHKSLAYIQTAKHLNVKHAGHYSLTVSTSPGFKRTKPETLSRQFTVHDGSLKPETIVLSSCVAWSVTWEIETTVRRSRETSLTQEMVHLKDFLSWRQLDSNSLLGSHFPLDL